MRFILVLGAAVLCACASAGTVLAGDWTKSPANPLLLPSPGEFDSYHITHPQVVQHDDAYYMYYAGAPTVEETGTPDYRVYQIGLAVSDDGVNFNKLGPILPVSPEEQYQVSSAPLRNRQGELLIKDGLWHMVYSDRTDRVWYATSPDGLNWGRASGTPIYSGAYAPSLMEVGDEIWMYYTDKTVSPWALNLAKGPDLYSLTPVAENPVLESSQAWEGGSNLFYPYVLEEEGAWKMYYASYYAGHATAHTAIGEATSDDGINWTKNPDNPVLTPTPGSSYDSIYTSSQCVIRDGDEWKMYYAGRIDSDPMHKYYSINLATKPVEPPQPPPAITIGYYRFEETPLGHHATWAEDGGGPVGTSSNEGVVNVADVFGSPVPQTDVANDASLYLPGTPNVVDCGDNYDIGTGDFTVEFFMKAADGNIPDVILSKGDTDGTVDGFWGMYTREHEPSNSVLFDVRGLNVGDRAYAEGTTNVMDNEWHHVAGVVDRTAAEVRLYIDGNLEGATSMSGFNSQYLDNAGPMIMGARYVGDNILGNWYEGLLDEVRISNSVLSPEQFLRHIKLLPGDASGDGTIDEIDAAILAGNWMMSGALWGDGDFNGDGIVDDIDATMMAANWGAGPGAAAPEPSTWALLAGGLVLAVFMRLRKKGRC